MIELINTGKPFPYDRVLRIPAMPRGDDQTTITLAAMRAIVDHCCRSDIVHDAARSLAAAVPTHIDQESDEWEHEYAAQVYRFVQQTVKFRMDPIGVEVLRIPEQMLTEIMADGKTPGDCDEGTTLVCALLRANRIRALAATVTPAGDLSGPFQHVLPAAEIGSNKVVLDAQQGCYGQLPPHGRVKWWRM